MRRGRALPRCFALALLSLALAAAVAVQRLGLGERLDLWAFDRLAPFVAEAPGAPAVVVVEIDQQSLEELGRWPWPRRLHAELIDRLAAAGPAVIGYDVLFAEPAAGDLEGDALLTRAVAGAGTVVLPVIAELPAYPSPPVETLPFGSLPEAAAALGHGHLGPDPDGRLRRLSLRAGVGDAYWPAFAAAVAAVARSGSAAAALPDAAAIADTAAPPPRGLDWVAEAGVLIPVPRSTTGLDHVSARDVLREPPRSGLAGTVVLVGATARGLQAWVDIGPAASTSLAPPLYFNAFAVQALLRGQTLERVQQPDLVAALLAGLTLLPWLAAGLVGAGAVARRVTLAAAPLPPLVIGLAAFFHWQLVLPFASAILAGFGLLCATQLVLVALRLRRARQQRRLAHAALAEVADAVLTTTDPGDRVDYANPAAERLLARPHGKLVGEALSGAAPELARLLQRVRRNHGDGLDQRIRFAAGRRLDGVGADEWRALPLTAADGSRRIVKAVVRRRGDARRRGHVIALNDITDEQRLLDEVAFRATHDGLTRLPNRHLLLDRLGSAIERARRHGRLVGVASLDIDRLKSINDALGHAIGDAVLVEVARRLAAIGRSSDTVGRIGGDEFVLLLEDIGCRQEIEAGLERYRQCLAKPLHIDGRRLAVKASIGVACFPTDGEAAEDLLRGADAAMHRAKSAGRDQVVTFDATLDGERGGGLLLDAALRQGIERDELELHYQPRIDLARRRPAGIEALVRWRHPEHGFLPPGRFIGLAEETGSIVELGRWVLARALADLAGPALRPSGLRLSINVSVVQLKRDPGFVDFIRARLAAHGIAPGRLELEITESLFLDPSLPMLGRRLTELAELGVHLSIDDFGTGYSSLAYINRFPFDRIKIDRSFVHAAGRDKGAQAIIRAIVNLSEALAKKTTAEGVEETDQLAFLDQLNCNEAQGYLFGRPVPLPELVRKLAA